MRFHTCCVVFITVVLACGKTAEPGPSDPPASRSLPETQLPWIVLTPEDVKTDLGATPLRVAYAVGEMPDAVLDETVKLIQLRSYPELVDVPFTTKVSYYRTHPWSEGPLGKDAAPLEPVGPAQIDVLPNSPLDPSRWYVLSVSSVPNGVSPLPAAAVRPKLGAYSARFRVGSAPVVRRVQVYSKGTASVDFSENVAIDETTITQYLSLSDTNGKCAYMKNGSTTVPPTLAGVFFHCTGAFQSKLLQIELKPGLKSSSNAPLATLNSDPKSQLDVVNTGAQLTTLSLAEVCSSLSDCIRWRP